MMTNDPLAILAWEAHIEGEGLNYSEMSVSNKRRYRYRRKKFLDSWTHPQNERERHINKTILALERGLFGTLQDYQELRLKHEEALREIERLKGERIKGGE